MLRYILPILLLAACAHAQPVSTPGGGGGGSGTAGTNITIVNNVISVADPLAISTLTVISSFTAPTGSFGISADTNSFNGNGKTGSQLSIRPSTGVAYDSVQQALILGTGDSMDLSLSSGVMQASWVYNGGSEKAFAKLGYGYNQLISSDFDLTGITNDLNGVATGGRTGLAGIVQTMHGISINATGQEAVFKMYASSGTTLTNGTTKVNQCGLLAFGEQVAGVDKGHTAAIGMCANQNATASTLGTNVQIQTTRNGTINPVTRVFIGDKGEVGFSTTSVPATYGFAVDSPTVIGYNDPTFATTLFVGQGTRAPQSGASVLGRPLVVENTGTVSAHVIDATDQTELVLGCGATYCNVGTNINATGLKLNAGAGTLAATAYQGSWNIAGPVGIDTAPASNRFMVQTSSFVVTVSSNGYFDITTPAISSTTQLSGCGTGASFIAGSNNQRGEIITGTSPGNTCTVTFAQPGFASRPFCVVSGQETGTGVVVSLGVVGQNTFTFTCDNSSGLANCAAATLIDYICLGK